MKDIIKFEDIPAKKVSMKAIEAKLSGFTSDLKAAKDTASALKVIRALEKYMDKFENNVTVISIRYTLDSRDEKIAKLQDQIDEISPLISNLINGFNKVLVKHPCRKELEEKLTPYYFQMIDNSLKSFDEKIIPELIEINKLSSQYDKVLGSAEIPFRGQTYNISQLGKFTKSNNEFDFYNEVNEQVYCAENVDGLIPASKKGRIVMRYPGTEVSAAVLFNSGSYKVLSVGFPLETLKDRNKMCDIFRKTLEEFKK